MKKYFAILDNPDLGSSRTSGIDAARRLLLDAVRAAGVAIVEVDLNTQRIGASFVGVLAEAAGEAKRLGGRLVLANVSMRVAEVLRLCGYEHLIASPTTVPERHYRRITERYKFGSDRPNGQRLWKV